MTADTNDSDRGKAISACGPVEPEALGAVMMHEYMITHTLPAFREMGLTAEEETAIMRDNPQRILTIK